MRMPAVAGQFYPDSPKDLLGSVADCYEHPLGPGEPPRLAAKGRRAILGIVSPHAGYQFSGPVAAHGFAALASDGFPETFVIIGPNHTGMGEPVAVSLQPFKTPLGVAACDEDLAKAVAASGAAALDERAHRMEHSIEVQLPFLQHIKKDIKFVAIVMGEQTERSAAELGAAIADAAGRRDVVVIASSDFTHCGYHYGQMPPPGVDAGRYAKERDALPLAHIKAMEAGPLVATVRKKNITMCGPGPVSAMLTFAKRRGAVKTTLLKYASSYDIMPGNSAVGYASIIASR